MVSQGGPGSAAGQAPSEQDDTALVAALLAGSEAAFETLVRTYGARLLGTSRRILGNAEDAQDAVQEAFLSAFRALSTFKGSARFSTWLHQIAINACLMKLRTRRRKPEEDLESLLPKFMEDGHHLEPPSAWADAEGAEALIEREQTRAFVRQCIDRLPESYRTILLLRDIEEMDTEQSAHLLGVNAAVVKTRLHRARMALRTLLDERFGGPRS